jgi:hypothetical protein
MKRLLLGLAILALSIVLLGFGLVREFPVYEEDAGEEDLAFYEPVSEVALTEDATFSGVFVSKKTGRLISNYDRSQPHGRKACPT